MKRYFDMSLEEYQRELTEAGKDPMLVCAMVKAARDLESDGYAVIEGVVEPELCTWAEDSFWSATTAASGGRIARPKSAEDMKDFQLGGNWFSHKHGILEHSALSHLPYVHAIRCHPRVATVFANLYAAREGLIVAPDRVNYQIPPEFLRPSSVSRFDADRLEAPDDIGRAECATWLHVDQSFLKEGRHCIQGLVTLHDAVNPGDASLEIVKGSHMLHDTLEKKLSLPEKRPRRKKDWYMFSAEDKQSKVMQSALKDLKSVKPVARGSLVLWDSRAWHQGGSIYAHPLKFNRLNPTPRHVVYVTMQPALGSWDVEKKRKIFREHLSTSHWPLKSEIFPPPRTWGKPQGVFDFSKEVVSPVESQGKYPVLEQLFGLTKQQTLKFGDSHMDPLLEFHKTSGVLIEHARGQKRLTFNELYEELTPEMKKRCTVRDDGGTTSF